MESPQLQATPLSPGTGLERLSEFPELQPLSKRTIALPQGLYTLLEVVNTCNNYTLPEGPWSPERVSRELAGSPSDHLVPFFVSLPTSGAVQTPIGFVPPHVLSELEKDNVKMSKMRCQPCWAMARADEQSPIWAVAFADWMNDDPEALPLRTEHMDRLMRNWKEAGVFAEHLKGWRDEKYCIWAPHKAALNRDGSCPSPLPGGDVALLMERAGAVLFSFLTTGVHMNGYFKDKDGKYHFWIPRRSATKQTYPNMLDNTVAGGITERDAPLESIIREAMEEASLENSWVENRIRAGGIVSYTRQSENGWLYPEIQCVYDLEFPADQSIIPRPNDSEVDSFGLYTTDEVVQLLVNGEFKPNCALVLIDFFVRHGLLSYESDTRFLELCKRLRSDILLPGPA